MEITVIDSLPLGARVKVQAPAGEGTVRFTGTTSFAQGEWVGVELDKQDGKNNGSVKGERYFECRANYGVFVRPDKCEFLELPKSEDPKFKRQQELKRDLSVATDDHDLPEISRLIDAGSEAGVPIEDMEAAQRILYADLQRAMYTDIEDVRSSVSKLICFPLEEDAKASDYGEAEELQAELGNVIEEHFVQFFEKDFQVPQNGS